MALNFPADPSAQTPENTYSPDSTPLASGNGVTYFWDGEKWTASTGTQEDIYLSKITDDVAEGAITFKGKTTHEATIEVTSGIIKASGLGSNFIKSVTENNVENGEEWTAFVANKGVSITSRASRIRGFVASNLTNAADETYGFYSDITYDAGGSRYNFYAADTAPNYFAGDVTSDGTIGFSGKFSLRMETDDPAAFQTTYTTDEEGNQVEQQEYIGTTEDLLTIIKDLRARLAALEADHATLMNNGGY